VTIGLVILFGLLVEKLFFRSVRDKKPRMVPLVVSIGLSILLQSGILIAFGPQIQTISNLHFESISVANKFLVTPNQIVAVAASVILTAGLILFLKKNSPRAIAPRGLRQPKSCSDFRDEH